MERTDALKNLTEYFDSNPDVLAGRVRVFTLGHLVVDAVNRAPAYKENMLIQPGMITGTPGANDVAARNIGLYVLDFAERSGYTVDKKRYTIELDEEHNKQLLHNYVLALDVLISVNFGDDNGTV